MNHLPSPKRIEWMDSYLSSSAITLSAFTTTTTDDDNDDIDDDDDDVEDDDEANELVEWFSKRPAELTSSRSNTELERSRLVLKRFKRLVRRVIVNLEWFKALNDEYSRAQTREKLLQEFYEHGDRFGGLVDDKMLEFVFNKVRFLIFLNSAL